ncbi:anaerobic ribonucleoside-triphosphate reductase activating protein [Candidatus Parcubacteria bacterium]|nr:anaerobic ribonucleoside-triphosphate reductase activating protein [Candidatus Parcubacteria bacterium]
MEIVGLQRLTLVDFPGRVACTVFTPGCNFRCPFCHNRDLVLRSPDLVPISEEDFFEFLKKRRGKLDGVAVTGGEPLLQKGLGDFLRRVKSLGFATKLDTNGSNSTALRRAVERGLVDYIAFDIKAPLDERYSKAIGVADSRQPARADPMAGEVAVVKSFNPSVILESIKTAVEFGVPFELRTTVVPTIHTLENLTDLARQLREFTLRTMPDVPPWYLQQFQSRNCLDPKFDKVEPYATEFFKGALLKLRAIYPKVEARI